MNKERDLLPWILGGLAAATAAVALTVISTAKTATPAPVVAAQPPSSAVSAPLTAPLAAPTAEPPLSQPEAAQTQPAAVLQAAVEPEQQRQEIWECTTNGIKTFSNNPCGEKSTLLDIAPINTMSATPALHYARGYAPEPRYATSYTDQAPTDAEEDSQAYSSEQSATSYAIVRGFAFLPRRRPEHHHRPPDHHNPVPVRRY
jgi:hypothetical protein